MRHDSGQPPSEQAAVLRLFEKSEVTVSQLPATRALLESFVGESSNLLKDIASIEVKVALEGVQQGLLHEMLPTDGDVVAATGFIPEWNDHAYSRIDRLLLFRVLDAMFGGDHTARVSAPDRALTALERSVALRLTRELMARLSTALSEVCPFTFRSERLIEESDPASAQKSRSVFLLCRLGIAEFQDHIDIAIPVVGLELARDRLSVGESEDEIDLDPNWTQAFRRNVGSTNIRLVASVDAPEMLLSDIAQLQPGAMLEFEGSRLQTVLVESEDKPVFVGRLGQSQGVFTVCIEKPASPRGRNPDAA